MSFPILQIPITSNVIQAAEELRLLKRSVS